MQSFFKKILALMCMLLLSSETAVYAVSPEIEAQKALLIDQISEYGASNCRQSLVPVFEIEMVEFMEFVDNTFKNKSSNTSLLTLAIARYSKFKLNMESLVAQVQPSGQAASTYKDDFAAYSDCVKIMETYVSAAKDHLIKHVKNNTAQKKTTVMVEKYRAINDKLREMNIKIAKMYGLFLTFKDKFPGFLKECQ